MQSRIISKHHHAHGWMGAVFRVWQVRTLCLPCQRQGEILKTPSAHLPLLRAVSRKSNRVTDTLEKPCPAHECLFHQAHFRERLPLTAISHHLPSFGRTFVGMERVFYHGLFTQRRVHISSHQSGYHPDLCCGYSILRVHL